MINKFRAWFTPFRVATMSWLAGMGLSIVGAVFAYGDVDRLVWATGGTIEASGGAYALLRARARARRRGSARVELVDFDLLESERPRRDPTRRLDRARRSRP